MEELNDHVEETTETEETQTPDELAELKATVEKLEREKGSLQRRLTKTEKALVDEPEAKEEEPQTFTRDEAKLIAQGYTDEEISFIQKNGGVKALENPIVKSALDASRKQRETENATDIPDNAKVANEGYTQSAVDAMSAEEYRQKVLKE